jgi:hypothetical protein
MSALKLPSFRNRVCLGFGWLMVLAVVIGMRAAGEPSDKVDSIRSSGGRLFAEPVELTVQPFAQSDPRWSEKFLGPTKETLGYMGCALTSVVMVLNYYGIKSNPGMFNQYLTTHSGYDDEGYLAFWRVSEFAPRTIHLAYQGACSHDSLDRNLIAGHPIIVQVTLADGGMHFVVVAGKRGLNYLVCDPAAYPTESPVRLQTISPRIDHEYLFLPNN